MTTQTEMFPKTTMEVLESLRVFHLEDVDKATTALDNLGDDEKIARRYEKAEERLAAARDLVSDIDRALNELRTIEQTPAGVPTTATDVVVAVPPAITPADFTGEVAAELDAHGVEYRRDQELPGVDPITGEVTSKATEPNVSVVIVLYPGSDEPVVTKIGDRTRYGELVADYFTAAGIKDNHPAKDWTVVAEDEITTTGGVRKLRDVIEAGDYGRRLLVVAADQGSVTGVDVKDAAR